MRKSKEIIADIESLIHSSNNNYNSVKMRTLLSKLKTRGKLTDNLQRRAQNRNLTWMAKHYYRSNASLSSGNSNFYNSNNNFKNEAKKIMNREGYNKSTNIVSLRRVKNYFQRKVHAAPTKPYSILNRELVRLLNKKINLISSRSHIRNLVTGARETGRRIR
jgi:hypothetical protein